MLSFDELYIQTGEEKQPGMLVDGLKETWMEIALPGSRFVSAMLAVQERMLLYHLASEYCTGRGSIVDAGCFLGGSTRALALGLRDRQLRTGCSHETKVHSYDLFETEDWTIGNLVPSDFRRGQSFRPLFEDNIRDIAHLVEVHEGDITHYPWSGGPIEVLFVDCAKTWYVSDFISYHFFRALIPGHSVVIQQDYIWHSWNAWLHITMEYYSDYFQMLTLSSPPTFKEHVASVAFLYLRKVPLFRPALVASMDANTKLELLRRARERFDSATRDCLERSHRQYITSAAWPNGVDPLGHRLAAKFCN